MRFQLLSLFIALLLPLAVRADDSPQWGGSWSRNMVSAEQNLPTTFSPGEQSGANQKLSTSNNIKWVAKPGSFVCATPTIAGGKVFIGSMTNRKGNLSCFDEATGKLLWQWSKPCRDNEPGIIAKAAAHWISDEVGVCSTPVVEGDRLYFVDQNCVVICLDVNGKPPAPGAEVGEAQELWTFDMVKDEHVGSLMSDASNSSPLLDGDILYVTTSNGVDRRPSTPLEEDSARRCLAPNAPSLIALDKNTGRFLAKDAVPIAPNLLHGQWSSPSMGVVRGKKLLFFGGGDGTLYAFNALKKVPAKPVTLELAWWADCIPAEYRPANPEETFTEYCLGDRRRVGNKN